jgi:hypothetical protein
MFSDRFGDPSEQFSDAQQAYLKTFDKLDVL